MQQSRQPTLSKGLTKMSTKLTTGGDTTKKVRKMSHVFTIEEGEQLELDESEINELDQNMQVYLRFQKSRSLRSRMKNALYRYYSMEMGDSVCGRGGG